MRGTRWLFATALLLMAHTAVAVSPAPPIDGGGVTGLDLQTQLEKGLRARRPVEFEYIREIVLLVEEEQLPRKLVASTFIWAMRKPPTMRVQYFAFALQARAKGLDVKLPDLRKQLAPGTQPPVE